MPGLSCAIPEALSKDHVSHGKQNGAFLIEKADR